MKAFSRLYAELDDTTRTNRKVDALVRYFRSAPPEDAIWAIRFLMDRKPRQAVPTRHLRKWAAEVAGIPDWLFDASYDTVGDLAETIALLLPETGNSTCLPLHHWVTDQLLALRSLDADMQRKAVLAAWREMDTRQRFVWNKLITGGFRIGVSRKLVTRALARVSGIDEPVIAHRLMGQWAADSAAYHRILSADTADADLSRPYPFCLAYPLDQPAEHLGPSQLWQAEWKWDGIRAQVIRREGRVFIWSRGEELITDKFPELAEAAQLLPDGTVLDGEILPWQEGLPMHFSALQRRIGRKRITRTILDKIPVVLVAYDLLEAGGTDIRQRFTTERSGILTDVIDGLSDSRMIRSPLIPSTSWDILARCRDKARSRHVEGLMLKRLDVPYGVGRRRGDWWKWKVDPFTVDAVLIYAQKGHGRRSGLFTDYTFGVWDNGKLVPFAKAYSGLTDGEIRQVDRFIQRNTIERYGPVRAVKAELVFEIAFENIRESSRHKSGVAVRFPRISRWRTDKTVDDADRLETIKALLRADRSKRFADG